MLSSKMLAASVLVGAMSAEAFLAPAMPSRCAIPPAWFRSNNSAHWTGSGFLSVFGVVGNFSAHLNNLCPTMAALTARAMQGTRFFCAVLRQRVHNTNTQMPQQIGSTYGSSLFYIASGSTEGCAV